MDYLTPLQEEYNTPIRVLDELVSSLLTFLSQPASAESVPIQAKQGFMTHRLRLASIMFLVLKSTNGLSSAPSDFRQLKITFVTGNQMKVSSPHTSC